MKNVPSERDDLREKANNQEHSSNSERAKRNSPPPYIPGLSRVTVDNFTQVSHTISCVVAVGVAAVVVEVVVEVEVAVAEWISDFASDEFATCPETSQKNRLKHQ
jgi:hypothetical protein